MKPKMFQCPCCMQMIPIADPHAFKTHYDECLKGYDDYLQRTDKANQARIKLTAAIAEYNKTMQSIGYPSEAQVLIQQYKDDETGGHYASVYSCTD